MDTKMKWRLALSPFALAALVVPAVGGCDEVAAAQNAVCCTEFKVGGTIGADFEGSAQSKVAVQAVADFAAIASAGIDDLTGACRNIAQDLDADKAAQDAAEKKEDKRERMEAWCELAVSAIGSVKASAGGTITVNFKPPVCEASVSAKADCQAKCSVEGGCDIKANPPTCEGGSLEVACKGECTGKAGASVSCEGECTGSCDGSCTAQGGVECAGRCDGTCTASAQGGGSGIQADGTCQGVCSGTCEVTAPGVQCSGTCNGKCSASCKGTAEASVKCDGECKADFEPLKCSGGELKGGCQVDAKCDANCDASVKAKASCSPPTLKVAISGGANAEATAKLGKLKATFEANLVAVASFSARLKGMAAISASFATNVEALTDIKASCIPAVALAIGTAVDDLAASVEVTASLGDAAGIKSL